MKLKTKITAFISAVILSFSTGIESQAVVIDTTKDPNGDGRLSISDAVYIQLYLLGRVQPADLDQLDMDNNGIINILDANYVMYVDSGA